MMQLSKNNLALINQENIVKPTSEMLSLPEKVLQFGTGVLLRGLPDYFIDKANEKGLFNGRIVVVKSTEGDAAQFDEQDSLYTLCIRGVAAGKLVAENRIVSSISRVISAQKNWQDVLDCAANPEIKIIISNTTEVGLQLVNESIFQNPPDSFPAKLLSFLYARFKKFGADEASKIAVLPTELITDNGKKLQGIVMELAAFNTLETHFIKWLQTQVLFCNTLVDCIVPGGPERSVHEGLEEQFGYKDGLLIVSEVYRLWAIEGNEELKQLLSFAEADNRIIITPDITKYKELKLRLLNGTHTLSCGLAHLAGISLIKDAMDNALFSTFIEQLMLNELARAIPYNMSQEEALAFGNDVLERFRNPYVQHKWLNITLQYTSKMAQRTVPLLLRYFKLYKSVPLHFATGFAAYLFFMKGIKQEGKIFFGESNGNFYAINDAHAKYYFDLWIHDAEFVVHEALQNVNLWSHDLSRLPHFEIAVTEKLHSLMNEGALKTLALLQEAS